MNNFDIKPIKELLRADGSIIINKKLIHVIGINAAIIYSELVSRYIYFYERDTLTAGGYFYNTVDDLRLATGLGKDAQNTAICKLIELGLIKKKLGGIPQKRHFKIINNHDLLNKILYQGEDERIKLENELAIKADISKSRLNLQQDGGQNSNLQRDTRQLTRGQTTVNNNNNNNKYNIKKNNNFHKNAETNEIENVSNLIENIEQTENFLLICENEKTETCITQDKVNKDDLTIDNPFYEDEKLEYYYLRVLEITDKQEIMKIQSKEDVNEEDIPDEVYNHMNPQMNQVIKIGLPINYDIYWFIKGKCKKKETHRE